MGDIAQILAPTAATVPSLSSSNDSAKAVKIAGMSEEAMYLMKGKQDPSSASLPPVIPTFSKITMASASGDKDQTSKKGEEGQSQEVKVKVGSKWISSSKRARPWTWAPFASSSRSDGAMFKHWVRKNVEYTDYPYAKFDVHMDPVTYTPEEYEAHLQSEIWTRSETDRLMELARIFECRWPVIFDRFCFENSSNINSSAKTISSGGGASAIPSVVMTSTRKIEDLQHRYYGVAAILAQLRISQEAASEARALSVAAAKSAATTPTTAATQVATTSSTIAAASAPPSTDRISSMATQQGKTDNLLLESAAARSLATSAKQHQPLMTHVGTGTSNKMFDYEREQERRRHLDRLWRRSKEEEEEEIQLRKELKTIDAQLRKLKKHGGHILAAGTAKLAGRAKTIATTPASRAPSAQSNALPSQLSNAPPSRGPSRSATPIPSGASSSGVQGDLVGSNDNKANINSEIVENPDVLDEYFASVAPVPMSQYPYLQSGRLVPPATGGSSGINKSLLMQMNEVLKELSIPERPIPTKRVCDMYDLVRKDVLTLVTLKKMLMQREGQLQSKRLRLSRMGGSMLTPDDRVLDEERLLGISPPPKPSSSTAAGTSPANKGKATKRKSPSGAGAKSKTASKKATSDSKTTTSTVVKKKAVKRKRKADPSKSPSAASSNTSSKPSAPGSAAAKAAKARTMAAVGSAGAKPTTAQRSTTFSTAPEGTTILSTAVPKAASTAATTPRTKAVATAGAAAREKSNSASAAKRSRKS